MSLTFVGGFCFYQAPRFTSKMTMNRKASVEVTEAEEEAMEVSLGEEDEEEDDEGDNKNVRPTRLGQLSGSAG